MLSSDRAWKRPERLPSFSLEACWAVSRTTSSNSKDFLQSKGPTCLSYELSLLIVYDRNIKKCYLRDYIFLKHAQCIIVSHITFSPISRSSISNDHLEKQSEEAVNATACERTSVQKEPSVTSAETELGQMWTIDCNFAKAKLTSQLGLWPDN